MTGYSSYKHHQWPLSGFKPITSCLLGKRSNLDLTLDQGYSQ